MFAFVISNNVTGVEWCGVGRLYFTVLHIAILLLSVIFINKAQFDVNQRYIVRLSISILYLFLLYMFLAFDIFIVGCYST